MSHVMSHVIMSREIHHGPLLLGLPNRLCSLNLLKSLQKLIGLNASSYCARRRGAEVATVGFERCVAGRGNPSQNQGERPLSKRHAS